MMDANTQPIIKRHLFPVMVLLFLAPICGEVLSTSLPPLEFIQPVNLVFQVMLYGCGALLIRELMVRRRLGWLSVFLLGMAYGIYEEGLVVRSFFDPAWMDLSLFSWYGRWIGVNWVWTINLTLFHAVVSIIMPIMLVDLLFPRHKDRAWLKKGGLIVCGIAFASMLVFGIAFGMKASWLQLAVSAFSILLLAGLALNIHPKPRKPGEKTMVPAHFFWLALAGMLLFWLFYQVLPNLNVPPLLSFLGSAGLIAAYMAGMNRLDQFGSAFSERDKMALILGTLGTWFVFDILAQGDPNRTDNVAGLSIFAGLFFLCLLILRVIVRRRGRIYFR